MSELALLQGYLLVGAILIGLGLIGFVVRRNMIVMFLCAEMCLQGVSLSFVAWSRWHNNWDGQMMVVFIIAVAACEAAVALALIMCLCMRSGRLDIAQWQQLREPDLPAYADREVPEPPTEQRRWPELTPAGPEPQRDPEQQWRPDDA